MPLKRRTLLKAAALAGGSAILGGCEGMISETTRRLGLTIPENVAVPNGKEIDPYFHLLSRAGFGPWPGDLEQVKKQGMDAWIDEQLAYDKIDDSLGAMRARRFETINLKPGDCYDFKKEALRDDITRYTLLKAVYSKRQLFEVMVAFWTDHLNINLEKGDCIYLKAADDRDVVRAHALGSFKEMIRASCLSPAMLVYLDGKENKRAVPADIPNENYARELLELHTLGVDGGYSQRDVYEAARCLTGWRLRTEWGKGTIFFDPELHDDGKKVVLGEVITAGSGERDVDKLVDIVVEHPSTARYIATKLVRHFVSEDPPLDLVERVARKFQTANFEIKPVLRLILTSKEFQEHRGNLFKLPFRFMVSALRALGADTFAHTGLTEYLSRMGHSPFQYPTPDGYPEEMLPWLGTLLWRWNFALALACNQLESVNVSIDQLANALTNGKNEKLNADLLFRYFVGRMANATELACLSKFQSASPQITESADGNVLLSDELTELLGLVISSPAFQRF